MSSPSPAACADAIRAILAQPELTSAATAIWVSLDTPDVPGVTSLGALCRRAPQEKAIALLEERLAVHDALVGQVRANILALARQECVRILHVAAADDAADQAAAERAEASRTPASKVCLPSSARLQARQQSRSAEIHRPAPLQGQPPARSKSPPSHVPQQPRSPLAATDRAAMIANLDLTMSEPTASDALPPPDLSKLVFQAPPHELTARKLMRVISNTISELRLYDEHAAQHRAAHEQALKLEVDKAAQSAASARSF